MWISFPLQKTPKQQKSDRIGYKNPQNHLQEEKNIKKTDIMHEIPTIYMPAFAWYDRSHQHF